MKTILLYTIIMLSSISILQAQSDSHVIINSDKISYELAKIENIISEEVFELFESDFEIYLPDEFYHEMNELKEAMIELIDENDFAIQFDDEYSFKIGEFHNFKKEKSVSKRMEENSIIKEDLLDSLEKLDEKDKASIIQLKMNLESWKKLNNDHSFEYHTPIE